MSLTQRREVAKKRQLTTKGTKDTKKDDKETRRQGERQILFSSFSWCPLWFNLFLPLRLSAFA
jgi:hypothetical protein